MGTTPKGRTQVPVDFPGPRKWEQLPGKPRKKGGNKTGHTDKINKVGKVEKPAAKERRMFTQGDRLGGRKEEARRGWGGAVLEETGLG